MTLLSMFELSWMTVSSMTLSLIANSPCGGGGGTCLKTGVALISSSKVASACGTSYDPNLQLRIHTHSSLSKCIQWCVGGVGVGLGWGD